MRFSQITPFIVLLTLVACEDPETDVPDDTILMETNPYVQNEKLARSINLGNILEAPNEGDWGLSLEESYFSTIGAAGFTGVRLPVRWSTHADLEPPYGVDPSFLARVDWAIDKAFENDLSIVVNMHHYTEMMEMPESHLPRLLAIWHQLSTHFKDRSDDLILELFNEPHGKFTPELWNDYLVQIIDTIRTVDPYRTLMIGTASWGGIGGLNNLALPSDPNLIVTVHYYEPFHFTHQGAEWSQGSEAWLGTTWGQTNEDYANLVTDFNRLRAWSVDHDRPIYVGEFGAYHRAEMAYRLLWTQAVVNVCEDRDLSWGYWEFASGFGAYDRTVSAWNPLVDVLIPD